MQLQRHQEFIRFLNTIEGKVPARRRSTPSSTTTPPTNIPRCKNGWPGIPLDVPLHTSASWFNAVEGFFAKLARRRLKRGVFRSVDDLKAVIDRFVIETNANPKPFVWTANPELVLDAIKRGKRQSTSAAVAAAGVYSAGNTAWIFRPVRSICSRRIRVASRVRRSIIAWAMAVCSAGTSRSG